ncbi:hypothetical protein HYW20_04070 [Candidatus Woesearchaeota archaeon]|nr:hypothetical protein [Candidatus Woesearchaeota archaeon]
MANHGILSGLNPSDISQFKKDFMQMIKVGAEIDRYYGEARHDLDTLIPKFEKLTEQFNKKYKGIRIRTRKSIEYYKTRLFLKERGIHDFFANSASRISGLKSAGRTNFNQIEISDAEKFSAFLDSLLDKVYISYLDQDSGTSTIAAVFDRTQKMVELVYSPAELMNENSAGFKICAFYALNQGYDRKIEIYGSASTFGFSNLLNEIEKREWYDKFDTRFLE